MRDVAIAVITSKDDSVKAGFAPELHEVNDVPEAQRGVTGENHAGLTELAAEVSVNAGVVLQLVGLDELKHQQHIQAPVYQCDLVTSSTGVLVFILVSLYQSTLLFITCVRGMMRSRQKHISLTFHATHGYMSSVINDL